MALCSHTPTRPCAPPLCSCPCMCRTGLDIKSARCFSEPACIGCSPLTTMSVTSAKKRKSIIRVRDDDGGAALHCIRSTSCHPSPGQRKYPAQLYVRNCMRGTFSASNHHTRSCSRVHANKQTAADDGAHRGAVDTQTRRHGRPEQERPAVIGLPIRICPAGKPKRPETSPHRADTGPRICPPCRTEGGTLAHALAANGAALTYIRTNQTVR